MVQPPAYNREKNFTLNNGRETDHAALNAELDRASNSINDIRTNLAILQADDGKLRPAVVTADSISEELRVSLVEGVVMDAQSMLDRSLAAADASSKSAAVAKASETVALECKMSAVQSATSAQQSAAEAAESAGKAKQVNADWNATSGKAQILNKPTTLAGLELADIHTRVKLADYSVGDVVIAPYLEDAILVCTTAGTTSGEELSRDIVIAGSDIEDGSVVWNVRNKFSTGLKKEAGTVSLDSHASETTEFGGGNSQYYGHVKVIDEAFANQTAEHSLVLSPFAVKEMINNVMLGKNVGLINTSQSWVCPASGQYTVVLVGGGGGGGGGGGARKANLGVDAGQGGGGGGCAEVLTQSVYIEESAVANITIGAGGKGGGGGGEVHSGTFVNNGGTGGNGGATSFIIEGQITLTALGGGGGRGITAGTNANENNVLQSASNGGQGGGGKAGTGSYPSVAGGVGGNGASIHAIQNVMSYGNGGGGGGGGGTASAAGGAAIPIALNGNATSGTYGASGGAGAQGVVFIQLEEV